MGGIEMDKVGLFLQKQTEDPDMPSTVMKEDINFVYHWCKSCQAILSDVWVVPSHHVARAQLDPLLVNIEHKKNLLTLNCMEDVQGQPVLLDALQKLMGVLALLMKKEMSVRLNFSQWSSHMPFDTPHQPNGWDCGPTVCTCVAGVCGHTSQQCDERHSMEIREWLAHVVLSTTDNIRMKSSDVDVCGLLPGNVLERKVTVQLPGSSAWTYFCGLSHSLYKATKSSCAANFCIEDVQEMIFCCICREWYHPSCVKDSKRRNFSELYECTPCILKKCREP